MNRLREFMKGRYGNDQLSMALLALSLIVAFLSVLINRPVLAFLGYIPLFLCIFRMLSRNVSKRSMENYKFMMLLSPIYSSFNRFIKRIRDSKTHRHFKCPGCGVICRVPRGKGRVMITCPRCGVKFERKA